jgi:hypothetical protein
LPVTGVRCVKTATEEAREFANLMTGRSGRVEGDYFVYCRPSDDLADFGTEFASFPREAASKRKDRAYQYRTGEPALVRFLAAVTYAQEVAAENPGWIAEVALQRDGEDDQDTVVCYGLRGVKCATRLVLRGAVRLTDGWGVKHWHGSYGPDDVLRIEQVLAIINDYEAVAYSGKKGAK